MTLKTKALAALTAIAVSGFAFTSSAQAAPLTPIQKIQLQLQKLYGGNVVIVNPGTGQTYATDQQFATAVLASIKTPQLAKKNSAKAALTAAFGLAVESNPHYSFASTTILKVVSAGLANNTTQLNQAISGAFIGFTFSSVSSNSSAAAALVDSSLLGIKSTTLSANKLKAAYIAATKAAVKAAAADTASTGASVGAAAQFVNNSTLLSAVIKAAVGRASVSYAPIAEAIATAVKVISGGTVTPEITALIRDSVVAGYNAAFAASHGGNLPSRAKRAEILSDINRNITAGLAVNTGVGASGLANYSYNNLGNGPVTDIYGL